jgi:acyl carrier protein
MYRTGDLGRCLPNGDIAITGRTDFQIKVNGYRIEAGEVETRLVAVDGVAKAVVAGVAGARGDRLVAHVVPSGSGRPSAAELRTALRADLPDYMVPLVFVWHDELPLTRNGKVDRAKLTQNPVDEEEPTGTGASGAYDGPADDTERALAEIWASVLRRASVSPNDSPAALGGDSIAAARILTAVRGKFGVSLTPDQLAELGTICAMSLWQRRARRRRRTYGDDGEPAGPRSRVSPFGGRITFAWLVGSAR